MTQKTQIEYTNKRGQVVRVWPWTLSKTTTRYPDEGAPHYARGSVMVKARKQK